MTTTLTIDPGGANERVYRSDGTLTDEDFTRTHTGLSDWRCTVPRDRSLKDLKLSEIHLEEGDDFHFRGYLLAVDLGYTDHRATLAGMGIGYDLTNGDVTRTFAGPTFGHEVIETYIDEETTFDAAVTAPSAVASVSGEQAQEADTDAEFTSATSLAASDPFVINNGELQLAQSGFFQEAEDATGGDSTVSDGDYSGGSGKNASDQTHDISFTFTVDYTIPASNVGFAYRVDALSGTHPAYEVKVNGEVVDSATEDALSSGLQWRGTAALGVSTDLTPGTYTAEIDFTSGTGTIEYDCFHVYDGRFSYSYDNSVDGNGWLSGPELFPSNQTVTFDEVSTPWNIDQATLATAWNDTSGGQRIQLRISQQSWFPSDGTEDNTTSVTTSFGSEIGSNIQGRARFDRFGSRTTASPTTGFSGQQLEDWEITYDGDDVAIFEDLTVEKDHMSNLQTMLGQANMRMVVEHAKDSKTITAFRQGDETRALPSVRVNDEAEKVDVEDYWNRVKVLGGTDGNGDRISRALQSDPDVNSEGTQLESFGPVPELDTQAKVDSFARARLGEGLDAFSDRATLRVVKQTIEPGFSYTGIPIDGGAETLTAPLEEVSFQESAGGVETVLRFDSRAFALAEALGSVRGDVEQVRRGF